MSDDGCGDGCDSRSAKGQQDESGKVNYFLCKTRLKGCSLNPEAGEIFLPLFAHAGAPPPIQKKEAASNDEQAVVFLLPVEFL
jgi:hypothetical protein